MGQVVGIKATMYYDNGVGMGISKQEGLLVAASPRGSASVSVEWLPQRARSVKTVMGYYSPVIYIVPGHGHPDPQSAWGPESESAGGVVTRRTRYRSTDPQWFTEFMDGIGGSLPKPLVSYVRGEYTKDSRVPDIEIKTPGPSWARAGAELANHDALEDLMPQVGGALKEARDNLRDVLHDTREQLESLDENWDLLRRDPASALPALVPFLPRNLAQRILALLG